MYMCYHVAPISSKGLIMARVRRTIDQIIADTEAKLKALKGKKSVNVKAQTKLTSDSAGMGELLDNFSSVMKQHNVTAAEVIKAVARIKKTGLTIEGARKPRTPA